MDFLVHANHFPKSGGGFLLPAWQHVNQSIGSNLDTFVPKG